MKPRDRCRICKGTIQRTKFGWAHRSTKAKVLGHVPVPLQYVPVRDEEPIEASWEEAMTRWYACLRCRVVESYRIDESGNTTIPRGEFLVCAERYDALVTGFQTRQEAEAQLTKESKR